MHERQQLPTKPKMSESYSEEDLKKWGSLHVKVTKERMKIPEWMYCMLGYYSNS